MAITLALSAHTPLLLMDEPTNGLDIPSKTIFRKLVASFTEGNQTIIISTHQIRDLESLIDLVLILDNKDFLMNCSLNEVSSKLFFHLVKPDEKILYLIGAYIATFLVFIVSIINSDTVIFRSEQLQSFYIFGGLGTFIYHCYYAGKKVHFPKGVYMTLPASTLEKFLSILTVGSIIALIYILLVHITTIIIAQENIAIEWQKISDLLPFFLSIALFMSPLFFFSYITFSKHAFLIAICGSAMMIITRTLLSRFLLNGMLFLDPATITAESPLMNMFKFIWLYYGRILIIATIVILYVAYLKLKEKELR